MWVGEQFPDNPPHLFGHGVHGGSRLALEEVNAGQEVLGTTTVLQAGDELQQDAVYAVTDTRVVPLHLQKENGHCQDKSTLSSLSAWI